jgi:hypothetical protein
LIAIALLAAGCGRIGYEAEALDTISAFADGGSLTDASSTDADLTAPDGAPGAVDGSTPLIDAAVDPDAVAPVTSVNGSYDIPAPIQYSCAIGLVTIDFDTFTFADDMSSLTVTSDDAGAPAQPCAMVGPSAEETGIINVTCTLPGGCDEIYTLTGTFTDANNWSGTFTADFVGSCINCTNQSFPVAAGRPPPAMP